MYAPYDEARQVMYYWSLHWVPSLSSLSSVSFIDSLPADKHALHDIRFRFRVDNIWTAIAKTKRGEQRYMTRSYNNSRSYHTNNHTSYRYN